MVLKKGLFLTFEFRHATLPLTVPINEMTESTLVFTAVTLVSTAVTLSLKASTDATEALEYNSRFA